jgi:hypothetical protein
MLPPRIIFPDDRLSVALKGSQNFPVCQTFRPVWQRPKSAAARSQRPAFVKMIFFPPSGEFGQFRLLSASLIYLLHKKGFQIANSIDPTPGPAGR